MEYLWLLLIVFVAWFLITMAGAAQKAIKAAKQGEEKVGGTSLMPGIVIMPIFFTGTAWGIDLIWEQAGVWLVGGLHSMIAIVALGYLVYAAIYLKLNGKRA